MKRPLAILTLLLLASALVACGDDESTAPAKPVAATAASDELTGTSWTVSLKTAELEDPPDDLKGESSDWELSFDAKSMTLVNEQIGEIVNPMQIEGDVLELDVPTDCNSFSYAVEGDELVLTPAVSCPAQSIKSVLTTKPWKRSDA